MMYMAWNTDIMKIYNSHFKHVLSGIQWQKYNGQDTYTEYHLPKSILNYYIKDEVSLGMPWRHVGWGAKGITSLIHNLDTRWKRVVNFTPLPLFPRKRTLVPTE
jgi:hypothetical protein